ncbi:MAG TPA: hypothetical protein VEI97_09940, partial [bacterium]|nr:hypothetical protein [bacterium]
MPLRLAVSPFRALFPLLACLALLAGCTADESVRAAAVDPASPLGKLTVFHHRGRPVLVTSMARLAEFKSRLLQLRETALTADLIDAEFAGRNLEIDREFADWNLQRFYQQFADPNDPGRSGEERFRERFDIGGEIPEEEFVRDFERQFRIMAMVNEDEGDTLGVDRARAQFEQTPKEQWMAQYGSQHGWTTPEQVTFEPIANDIRAMMWQQQAGMLVPPMIQRLKEEYIREGRLTIHHLPGEEIPEWEQTAMAARGHTGEEAEGETGAGGNGEGEAAEEPRPADPVRVRLFADIEGRRETRPSPARREAAAAPANDDPIAYELDGRTVTFGEILLRPINYYSIKTQKNTLAERIAVDILAKEPESGVTDAEIEQERQLMILRSGGEDAFREGIKQASLTDPEMRDLLARQIMLRKIALQLHPVSEEDLLKRYREQSPAEWYAVYGTTLRLSSASEATFARVKDALLRDMADTVMNSNQAEINAWALDYLINRGEVIMENRQPKGFEVPNYGLPALPPGGPLPVDEGH